MIQKLHDIYRHARPKLPIAALFGMNLHNLISAADAALYQAKQAGRNRVKCGWPVPADQFKVHLVEQGILLPL